ncbi:hypothetical protein ACWD11_09920 [Streptomyces sp. NPDC002776]
MRKIITTAVLTAATLALAAPAHADTGEDLGNALNAASNGNFTAAAVCLHEAAVVPFLGDSTGDHVNNCSDGNVIDHSGR